MIVIYIFVINAGSHNFNSIQHFIYKCLLQGYLDSITKHRSYMKVICFAESDRNGAVRHLRLQKSQAIVEQSVNEQ